MRLIKCAQCEKSYLSPAKEQEVPKGWTCLNCLIDYCRRRDISLWLVRDKVDAFRGEWGEDREKWAKTMGVWHRWKA